MSSHDNPDENRPLETADIPEKQLETLREIESRPNATQAELAERLGVTSATISQRVNGIDGFDWSERQTFVARLFDRSDLPEPDDTNADGEAGPTRRRTKPRVLSTRDRSRARILMGRDPTTRNPRSVRVGPTRTQRSVRGI